MSTVMVFDTQIEYDYIVYECNGYEELIFNQVVDQHKEFPMRTINDHLKNVYGSHITIDWRDDQTCWVY